ncbi:hypothetical protein HDE_00316 [Halotydeus destructor]|nr:hypothetical protein HDE_00316 [Halotydeus destructor]
MFTDSEVSKIRISSSEFQKVKSTAKKQEEVIRTRHDARRVQYNLRRRSLSTEEEMSDDEDDVEFYQRKADCIMNTIANFSHSSHLQYALTGLVDVIQTNCEHVPIGVVDYLFAILDSDQPIRIRILTIEALHTFSDNLPFTVHEDYLRVLLKNLVPETLDSDFIVTAKASQLIVTLTDSSDAKFVALNCELQSQFVFRTLSSLQTSFRTPVGSLTIAKNLATIVTNLATIVDDFATCSVGGNIAYIKLLILSLVNTKVDTAIDLAFRALGSLIENMSEHDLNWIKSESWFQRALDHFKLTESIQAIKLIAKLISIFGQVFYSKFSEQITFDCGFVDRGQVLVNDLTPEEINSLRMAEAIRVYAATGTARSIKFLNNFLNKHTFPVGCSVLFGEDVSLLKNSTDFFGSFNIKMAMDNLLALLSLDDEWIRSQIKNFIEASGALSVIEELWFSTNDGIYKRANAICKFYPEKCYGEEITCSSMNVDEYDVEPKLLPFAAKEQYMFGVKHHSERFEF